LGKLCQHSLPENWGKFVKLLLGATVTNVHPGVGVMIREAYEAKRRERGGGRKYSVRALAEESNQDHSLISKVMRGRRPATREMLIALAGPLSPYFNLDVALVEAGFTPRDSVKRSLVRWLAELGDEAAYEVAVRLGVDVPPDDEDESSAQEKVKDEDAGDEGPDTSLDGSR
jgi:transcriptional regulator with XRE-family HTH domain